MPQRSPGSQIQLTAAGRRHFRGATRQTNTEPGNINPGLNETNKTRFLLVVTGSATSGAFF